MNKIINKYNEINLVVKIIIGLTIGTILGIIAATQGSLVLISSEGSTLLNSDVTVTSILSFLPIFGTLFVGALKAIAPVLVFFLIISAISNHKNGSKTNIGSVIKLYIGVTFFAALVAVTFSFLSPVELVLGASEVTDAPSSVWEILNNLLVGIVQNPLLALAQGNYLSILFWSVLTGLALRAASVTTKEMLTSIAEAISKIVSWVINLAPFGIMGLIFAAISENGIKIFIDYAHLIIVLAISMLFMAFVVNPIITYIYTKENPYPLVFKCLLKSGINAFFTRSSAANIPVNLKLCEEMDVNPEMYNISIPLGSAINMSGAAITITVLTLAAANTVGIEVSFPMAVLLSVIAAVSACGASGVAGGSILLIPLAASLFGIDQNVAYQVVAVGYIIGVIQDSMETALNSSSDALFTIIVDKREKRKILEENK